MCQIPRGGRSARSRCGYYDTAVALRDLVQKPKLLQLICLVAMGRPTKAFDANAFADEKLKILRR